MPSPNGEDRILRAKYLDWCSARLADRFMKLPPEEIYRLAQRASEVEENGEAAVDAGLLAEAASAAGGSGTYRDIVERLTAVLAAEMELPPYEDWREAYRSDAQRYETELLGFWEAELAETR